jgi:hypothetical protein
VPLNAFGGGPKFGGHHLNMARNLAHIGLERLGKLGGAGDVGPGGHSADVVAASVADADHVHIELERADFRFQPERQAGRVFEFGHTARDRRKQQRQPGSVRGCLG